MESHSSAQIEELQAQQSAAVAALEEKKRELASEVLTLKTVHCIRSWINFHNPVHMYWIISKGKINSAKICHLQ
ncbi:hypothetical protein PF001_g30329 [Phytophthora fragariae]|uniref:Uncharacterized protein n=3 Tax=Phytophthora fragariae TaxID=53985 RepID=A0A6A4B495_9STRA|nr:hypothetical protein PF001_g30329 [Phytophthora fragariae]